MRHRPDFRNKTVGGFVGVALMTLLQSDAEHDTLVSLVDNANDAGENIE